MRTFTAAGRGEENHHHTALTWEDPISSTRSQVKPQPCLGTEAPFLLVVFEGDFPALTCWVTSLQHPRPSQLCCPHLETNASPLWRHSTLSTLEILF